MVEDLGLPVSLPFVVSGRFDHARLSGCPHLQIGGTKAKTLHGSRRNVTRRNRRWNEE
tara:strand:- start:993 stop:1166 length:174 start_codon:yes stop_codon:yes gene_type:complete